MAKTDAVDLLRSGSNLEIARKMLTGVPWIFSGDASAFAAWRSDVAASSSALSAEGVFLVGSSTFGYSLAPGKAGREFRRDPEPTRSDIDIALVSARLFTDAWNLLIDRDRKRMLGGSRDSREKIRLDIYSGYVRGGIIPLGTSASRLVRDALAVTTNRPPFRGHPASARVYRREEDLVEYQIFSLGALRQELKVPS